MNYLVCIKQVPDTTTKMVIDDKGAQSFNVSNIKWIINPYDEMALEEALLLSEKENKNSPDSSKVYVVCVGPARAKEALRTALAMGAHHAIHIETEENLDSVSTAQAIVTTLKDKLATIDLILCGKLGIDGGFSCMPGALASLLKYPSVSCAVQIQVSKETTQVHQLLDGGHSHIFKVKNPFVVSVTKGINQPRYPTLPGIMKAKSKPLETFPLPSEIQSGIQIHKLEYLPQRPPVQMLEGSAQEQAQKLLKALKEEGVL